MNHDIIVIGAGPAGMAAAIRVKQLNEDISVCVLEKGSEIGAHILSGAVLNPKALDELLPEWRDEAPADAEVTSEDVTFLTQKMGFNLPIVPPPMHNKGNVIVSASRIARWMATKAEAMGVMIFAGFPAVESMQRWMRPFITRTTWFFTYASSACILPVLLRQCAYSGRSFAICSSTVRNPGSVTSALPPRPVACPGFAR